jgi:chorismate-pyruvate lyase
MEVLETANDLPDGVSSPKTDPLWDRTVLLLRSRELLLRAERFVALRKEK